MKGDNEMFQNKKSVGIAAGMLRCLLLAGCGLHKASVENDVSAKGKSGASKEVQKQQSGQETLAREETAEDNDNDGYQKGNSIEEQTFVVNLCPFGQVTFASYEPDVSDDPFADAVFLIKKDDEVLLQLPGMTADNSGNEVFEQVEAVSFLDYNYDNYDDIIVIVSYRPGDTLSSNSRHTTVRYYSGTAEGSFVYEEQMSVNASEALAEIPQLVEIGIDEATGSRVIHYENGSVHVTQLNRLYFSYIPHGNLLCNSEGHMDYYYDYVYKLIDGEMTLIASGTYGVADNSNVQVDENGEPIYEYRWEGVEMSEEDYQKELTKVYDISRAESCAYDDLVSADEMKKAVATYRK